MVASLDAAQTQNLLFYFSAGLKPGSCFKTTHFFRISCFGGRNRKMSLVLYFRSGFLTRRVLKKTEKVDQTPFFSEISTTS